MNGNNCLLCHDAACTKACGKMEPDRVLRSLYFDNEEGVRNLLAKAIPCMDCKAPCEDACVMHVDIKNMITSYFDPEREAKKLDYSVLRTDFCGISLENPFFLSSSVVASTYDMCARAFEAGWAGVAFKTICLMDIVEASPRFSAIREANNRIIGFKNIEQLSEHELKENIETFKRLKKNYPDKFLLVSIMGRDEEEWAYLTDIVNDTGADALELNFSCPNMTSENTGSDVGQVPELVERYTRVVKEHARIPFIVKLTPNVTHIEDSADAAIRGGADGVAAINTIKCLIDVDFDPSDGRFYTAIGGYSGKAVKPIAMRFISRLSKDSNLEGKHISAMGGIETWRDAMEFIALGANTVQVTTAIMQYGYRIIDDLKEGVTLYLMQHGHKSINEVRGTALEGIVDTEDLDRSYIIYPKFIRENCVACKRCYLSCKDGGHQAIEIVDGRPRLKADRCVGCHLCVLVCPMGAIVSSDIKVPKKKK